MEGLALGSSVVVCRTSRPVGYSGVKRVSSHATMPMSFMPAARVTSSTDSLPISPRNTNSRVCISTEGLS